MTHFAGKTAKVLILSATTALILAATAAASAADMAIGVGCTIGSNLRLRSEPNTSSAIITQIDKSEET